jgi:hypothetical protein
MEKRDFLKISTILGVGFVLAPRETFSQIISQKPKPGKLTPEGIEHYMTMFRELQPESQGKLLDGLEKIVERETALSKAAHEIVTIVNIPEIMKPGSSGYRYDNHENAILYEEFDNEHLFMGYLQGTDLKTTARARERLYAAFDASNPWKAFETFVRPFLSNLGYAHTPIDFQADGTRRKFSKRFYHVSDMEPDEAAKRYKKMQEKFGEEAPDRSLLKETIAYLFTQEFSTSEKMWGYFTGNDVYMYSFASHFGHDDMEKLYKAAIKGIGAARLGKSMGQELVSLTKMAGRNAHSIYDFISAIDKKLLKAGVPDAYERGIAWGNQMEQHRHMAIPQIAGLVKHYHNLEHKG